MRDFKIVIATDIHMGFKENEIIGNDSFETFEEVLVHAKQT
jgi:DNA repair exonuclease SbcCD nuclease subunit